MYPQLTLRNRNRNQYRNPLTHTHTQTNHIRGCGVAATIDQKIAEPETEFDRPNHLHEL